MSDVVKCRCHCGNVHVVHVPKSDWSAKAAYQNLFQNPAYTVSLIRVGLQAAFRVWATMPAADHDADQDAIIGYSQAVWAFDRLTDEVGPWEAERTWDMQDNLVMESYDDDEVELIRTHETIFSDRAARL